MDNISGQYYLEPKDPKSGCLLVILFVLTFWGLEIWNA